MKFNNQRMIEQAINTHPKEVEVLYWHLEDALHNGNPDKAKALLDFLLYIGKYKSELIQSELHQDQRKRLKNITHQILDSVSIEQKEAITIKFPIKSREIPFKNEAELQSHLVENKNILEEALEDRIQVKGTEVRTEGDYRCDIVVESDNTFYPIELKIAQGNHAVVSQCSKYCYYFYRKLRYDRFKSVQGVVIAPGYDKWSINELRRQGHWIFLINASDSDISLERVT